jgi:site-specific DNA-cytosine methylase
MTAVAFAENSRAELRLCGGDGSVSAQLTTGGGKPGQGQPCIVFANRTRDGVKLPEVMADGVTPALTSPGEGGRSDAINVAQGRMAVRRLTPRECERLQGFPDDHTLIPWRGKSPQDCPDGPRYKALGNSMAVPCMAWIGQRIAAQELRNRGTVMALKEPKAKLGNGAKRHSINAEPGEPMFTLQSSAQHGVAVLNPKVRYLSVCSGIEAASVAWEPLGWEPAAFAEVEKFPSAVLAHHWPQVPNLGDMTRHESWNLGAIDLLVGGTPCQSFSVAGLRKGLHDPRGGLMLTFLEIAQRQRPRWIVWENVPGVLSSHGGRDFGAFLGALGALGYGWAYRVLDAQWFGVAQRRRRVFVVGCLGDGAAAATVLFESESVCRNPAPSREKGQGVAADAAGGVGGRSWPAGVASTLRKENGSPGYANQDIFSQGGANLVPASAKAWGLDSHCTNTSEASMLPHPKGGPRAFGITEEQAPTLRGGRVQGVAHVCDTVGALTDGAHNGGGLTAKMPTPGAYSPCVANPLTARMGKGINTTLDEGQTPIVCQGEGCDDL